MNYTEEKQQSNGITSIKYQPGLIVTDTDYISIRSDPYSSVAEKTSPFLRWAGGKRNIMKHILPKLPEQYNNYWEPFVGGGALFFEKQPQQGAISDINQDLMITYQTVRDKVDELIETLEKHQKNHSSEYYYTLRAQHNLSNPVSVAARFIYLNKTCFNGLWRVNKSGKFNVPIGNYKNLQICDVVKLKNCNKVLQNIEIKCVDYTGIQPLSGDFCYFDPPYHKAHKTSFVSYTDKGFSETDHRMLAKLCFTLHETGVKIMVSNSNTPFIRELYSNNVFKTEVITAPRYIACKATDRKPVEEVIITNY